MDTTALRAAYDRFLAAAALPDLGRAQDGGWDADQVLAHVLSVDAGIAASALGVVAGARPGFDNRIALDAANLARIVAEHGGRTGLIAAVRNQGAVLCDVAGRLGDGPAAVLLPTLLVSDGEVLVDQPVSLGTLVDGLAADHLPRHTQQLLDLRAPGG